MPTRHFHRKSRHGCQACKSRRVKCDETGPPCANCKARDTSCEYAKPVAPDAPDALTPSSFTSSAVGETSDPPIVTRLVELELMHHWTSVGYKSMATACADDYAVWQSTVPKTALKCDFLLDGIFAIAAFEIAASCQVDRARYAKIAIHCQSCALSRYQHQLKNMTEESHEAILYFSIMLSVIMLGAHKVMLSSGEDGSAVKTTIDHFEMAWGAGWALATNMDCIKTNPMFRNIVSVDQLPKTPLDGDTADIFAQLTEINDRRMTSLPKLLSEPGSHAERNSEACRNAIFWLRACFETCLTPIENRSYCLFWVGASGKDYHTAVKEGHYIALLILMFWGVLVEKLGEEYWWAENFGFSLIDEISRTGLYEADESAQRIIQGVRSQVGLT
jgi:hypothetical protein